LEQPAGFAGISAGLELFPDLLEALLRLALDAILVKAEGFWGQGGQTAVAQPPGRDTLPAVLEVPGDKIIAGFVENALILLDGLGPLLLLG
jgi:hypothetical protein